MDSSKIQPADATKAEPTNHSPVAVPLHVWLMIKHALLTAQIARHNTEWPRTAYETSRDLINIHELLKGISDEPWMKEAMKRSQ